MVRQCAWCHCILGEVAPLNDDSVTHGLCQECLAAIGEPPRGADPRTDTPEAHETTKSA